jgi:hypothetical protein
MDTETWKATEHAEELTAYINLWNADEPIAVVEMGGKSLGTEYEQAIWTVAFTIVRDFMATPRPPVGDDSPAAREFWRTFGEDSIRQSVPDCTGAMAGAARNVAMVMLRDGVDFAGVEPERIIQLDRGSFQEIVW